MGANMERVQLNLMGPRPLPDSEITAGGWRKNKDSLGLFKLKTTLAKNYFEVAKSPPALNECYFMSPPGEVPSEHKCQEVSKEYPAIFSKQVERLRKAGYSSALLADVANALVKKAKGFQTNKTSGEKTSLAQNVDPDQRISEADPYRQHMASASDP
ncbi:hypothetical protein HPB47_001289 [Ixodes persulcatus]|uniref:Uncharacterized protein n=1 Tax=Ixodes persulcatus TaxID=34615 RepID=A0AC60PQ55_IXOPE|nr:hypothetical protein HPB47_001289 [Ixodes persulcatus]